ncbi:MAG: hypothetical protein HY474_02110 [Candidatus Sungbacteria bacterium]|uniref:Uncharacterized protein n=1 Tax=Candidatus Sungiibacteriota bacterium TaxID=2750080 RepID=A0A933DTY4_9BACT|nr:hypothetical protein [Candidatus Sungbacteria bacterium]
MLGLPEDLPQFNRVVYVILGKCCYFSGIERCGLGRYATSTINAAESIIKAISGQEGVLISALRWFDLQTHRGYKRRPGTYELDELLIGPRGNLEPTEGGVTEVEIAGERAIILTAPHEGFAVTDWRRVKSAPAEVLRIFQKYIGVPRPILRLNLDEAQRCGFVGPSDISDSDLERVILWTQSCSQMGTYDDYAFAIVDSEGYPEGLARSGGMRYSTWLKDETPP